MTAPKTACDGSQIQTNILQMGRRTVFLKPNLRTRIGTHHEKTRYERCGTFPNQFTSSRVMLNSFAVASAIAPNDTQFIPLTIFRSTYTGTQSTPLITRAEYEPERLYPTTVSYTDDTVSEPRSRLFGGYQRRRRCSLPHARNSNKRSTWINCITFILCFRLEFVHC